MASLEGLHEISMKICLAINGLKGNISEHTYPPEEARVAR